jgi:hypothetical protein
MIVESGRKKKIVILFFQDNGRRIQRDEYMLGHVTSYYAKLFGPAPRGTFSIWMTPFTTGYNLSVKCPENTRQSLLPTVTLGKKSLGELYISNNFFCRVLLCRALDKDLTLLSVVCYSAKKSRHGRPLYVIYLVILYGSCIK